MILRKFKQHIEAENWFAVSVDFLVIVVGIFVGLQVEGWNQSRKDSQVEIYYLERMMEDMEVTIDLNYEQINRLEGMAFNTNVVLTSILVCKIPPDDADTFAFGLFQLAKFTSQALITNTFTELIDTGNLNLISSRKLRQAISKELEVFKSDVFDQVVDRTMPHLAYIDARFILSHKGARGGDEPITREDIFFDFEKHCKDPLFAGAVSSLLNYTNDWRAQTQENLVRYKALSAVITKAYQEKTGGNAP
jgi:hypothetical protein